MTGKRPNDLILDVSNAQAAMQVDIGHLKSDMGDIKLMVTHDMGQIRSTLERLEHGLSDANLTPSGRQLVVRLEMIEQRLDRLDNHAEIETRERQMIIGSFKTIRAQAAIATFLAGMVSLAYTLHSVGLI